MASWLLIAVAAGTSRAQHIPNIILTYDNASGNYLSTAFVVNASLSINEKAEDAKLGDGVRSMLPRNDDVDLFEFVNDVGVHNNQYGLAVAPHNGYPTFGAYFAAKGDEKPENVTHATTGLQNLNVGNVVFGNWHNDKGHGDRPGYGPAGAALTIGHGGFRFGNLLLNHPAAEDKFATFVSAGQNAEWQNAGNVNELITLGFGISMTGTIPKHGQDKAMIALTAQGGYGSPGFLTPLTFLPIVMATDGGDDKKGGAGKGDLPEIISGTMVAGNHVIWSQFKWTDEAESNFSFAAVSLLTNFDFPAQSHLVLQYRLTLMVDPGASMQSAPMPPEAPGFGFGASYDASVPEPAVAPLAVIAAAAIAARRRRRAA
jgi:MYXO-CTERM domain-containing protein